MNYHVITQDKPDKDKDIQDFINASVPAAMQLISVSVFSDGGVLKIMIVFKG
jgi:hypothetical protein